MRKIPAALLLFCNVLTACSSQESRPTAAEHAETNSENSRVFAESPEAVLRAARAALQKLAAESKPFASGAVKEEGGTVFTGWVYSQENGRVLRRIYGYTVIPSATGTHVTLSIEEEESESGREEGNSWVRARASSATYREILRRIRSELYGR
jgi:hypothetical protein